MSARGGLYWGKINAEVMAQLRTWHTVILNESNWAEAAPALRAAGVRVGVSFARSVWVDPTGAPSAYWPVQRRIHKAATIFDGWVMVSGKPVEATAVPRSWIYDITRPAFRAELARIIARFCLEEKPDLVMFDELHTWLVGIPNGAELRHPNLWTRSAAAMLRQIGAECGGQAPDIITNGIFRKGHAPGMITGHFWQNIGTHPCKAVEDDRKDYDANLELILHCCPPDVPRDQVADFAKSVGASCWDWHPAPGLPFDRVYP